MKRQQLPLLLMLIAGAITSITVYMKGLGLKTMLIALLAALVAFYFLGSIIVSILDGFDKRNAMMKLAEEGEVFEKTDFDNFDEIAEQQEMEEEEGVLEDFDENDESR